MAVRFIDKLVKAARLEPVKKEIKLDSGDEIVVWVSPLTAAERDRAKKDARSEDANAFALQLLIQKATLRNEVCDSDLQKLMLAVLSSEEEGEELDMKSASKGA